MYLDGATDCETISSHVRATVPDHVRVPPGKNIVDLIIARSWNIRSFCCHIASGYGAVLLSALYLMLQQHQSGALQSGVQPGNQVTNGYVCAQAREQQIQTRQLAVQK